MKKKTFATFMACLTGVIFFTLIGSLEPAAAESGGKPGSVGKPLVVGKTGDRKETGSTGKKAKKSAASKSEMKSLAQRMAGRYSYHYSDENGNDEFYVMDVVPFYDNLYAFCGTAMTDDYKSLEPYSFWAAEFVPYDADELTSTDGDTVSVNELCFSIMSNAGMYWNPGHKGAITLTDDGLVFEGFDNDGFLVPEDDDSRLFLKDERVESAFSCLRSGKGVAELEGLWILDRKGADVYLDFSGANLYIYSKDPGSEVVYAAGGCDFSKGKFTCTANSLGSGGMPFELSCEYKVSGDSLTLKTISSDLDDVITGTQKYKKVGEGKVHVTTMDEVEFDSKSFGAYGEGLNIDELLGQEFYGVFVSSAKTPEGLTAAVDKLEKAGFTESEIVYTPDFSGLNPKPYYVLTTGLYTTESDAKKDLSELKAAGFKDAYVKKAGSYKGDRYWYTMYDGEKISILKDGLMLRDVTLSIPYPNYAEGVKADLLVTDETVFDKTADLQFFGNSKKGDRPREWIVRNYNLMHDDIDQYMLYGPALTGIFEVGLENNRITAYYGSYWWD